MIRDVLHWLPIQHGLHGVAPRRLPVDHKSMCQQVSENIDRHSLRSAARGDLAVPVLILLPHLKSDAALYRVKHTVYVFNCTTSQHVVQYKCDAESLICRKCLPNKLSSVSYVYADKFKILQHRPMLKYCLPLARMHESSARHLSMDASVTHC